MIIAGSILGLVIIWKVALVSIACTPLVLSTGYIRLVWSTHLLDEVTLTLIILIARRRPQGSDQQKGTCRICPVGL